MVRSRASPAADAIRDEATQRARVQAASMRGSLKAPPRPGVA